MILRLGQVRGQGSDDIIMVASFAWLSFDASVCPIK